MRHATEVKQPEYTAIEQRLLDALSDDRPHEYDELKALVDGECTLNNLRYHMSNLRTKVRRKGTHSIACIDGTYVRVAFAK